MVQLERIGEMASFNLPFRLEVKVEREESRYDRELHSPASKRSKISPQGSIGKNEFAVPPSDYNPLEEPSPLGLRLKKSPSLLDLIQMRLSQGCASSMPAVHDENLKHADKKDTRGTTVGISTDRLKASNFGASLLRIGCWEFVSRHEGDLVAKCYYAKHKLVWEILENGLKIKMEIQWSDIVALKANCPADGPGTLTLVLCRQPVFYRETNPQPRKHTLWQTSSDFTNGQANKHRSHYLEFPPGVLNKHFEKLVQCDARLKFLSQQSEIVMESPFFYAHDSQKSRSDELTSSGSIQLLSGKASPVSCLPDVLSPSISEVTSKSYEQWDTASSLLSKEAPSPSSAIEGNGNFVYSDPGVLKSWEQLKVPGIRPSMSMTDLVNHISKQVTSGVIPTDKASECQDILENISQVLLSDTHNAVAADEKSLMKRVNSLWSLLQDPEASSSLQANDQNLFDGSGSGREDQTNPYILQETRSGGDASCCVDPNNFLSSKPTPSMPSIDSFGDMLLQLPRIVSLSKFWFNIAEDDEDQTR